MSVIALAQIPGSPHKQRNLESMAMAAADAARHGARLVLFPEIAMAELPPGENLTAVAEPLDGPFARALASLASEQHLAIVAGMLETAPLSDRVFNTVVAFGADGSRLGSYRKIHLYDAFGYRESDVMLPGCGETLVFSLDGITFGVQTCYDIRFPEMTRRLTDLGADCILVPAAWVRGLLKEGHWEILLRARAVENTVYVAGAGLISYKTCGNSMLVDPLGVPVARAGEAPAVIVGDVSTERIAAARTANPSLANRRPELYAEWTAQRDRAPETNPRG